MARSKHHTGWAGALGVASELSRRGYDAAITLGNTPSLDLICSSPGGESFTVQVKTASTKTWVYVSKAALEKAPRPDLYYAIVFIPPDLDAPLEYYILTSAEAKRAYEGQRKTRRDGEPYKPGHEGLGWRDITPYVACWGKLP